MPSVFLSDRTKLPSSSSVGVLLIASGSRYLLQHRWNRRGLYYPGFWGLFGGGLKVGETARRAAHRELKEELGFLPKELTLVTRFDFDLRPLNLGRISRWFYKAKVSRRQLERMELTEGDEMRLFEREVILSSDLRVIPYDAFAIWLHESKSRFIPRKVYSGRRHLR